MRAPLRTVFRIGLLLLSVALDIILLAPLLTLASISPEQLRYVYYESGPTGIDVALDRQFGGYVTNLEVDANGDLGLPAGRSIAIPLLPGASVSVRTMAENLAPYVALGSGVPLDGADGAQRLADPMVLVGQGNGAALHAWNASRSWTEDRAWLRDLYVDCDLPSPAEALIRASAQEVVITIGSCSARLPASRFTSQPPLLLVATGPHAALISGPTGAWRQTYEVQWRLIGLAFLRVALLVVAVGAVPTAMTSAALFAAGQISRPEAIMCWGATLIVAVAAAAWRLVRRMSPTRPALAWMVGGVVVSLELIGLAAAIALLDIGTFGKERITREGDDACVVVGYSTVRGDSLREGTTGIVERLGEACARCQGRCSRVSREAQTLRWIRETVCSPSFPPHAGGELIVVGGGNDDLFFRPARFAQLLADFLTVIRFSLQPVDGRDWQRLFEHASQRVVASMDEQAADIDAIAQCANRGGRRLRFVHDFLVWDLEGARFPARQQTFARRSEAVRAAGGELVDLLHELGPHAGVAWFNDFIHPSAAGQKQIADLICHRLGTTTP